MKKKACLFGMAIVALLGVTGCGAKEEPETPWVEPTVEAPASCTKIASHLDNLHNGDAKFFRNRIATSVDGKLNLYNLNLTKQPKVYDTILLNWLDAVDEEYVFVYGNFQNRIGIAKMDENLNLLSNTIVMETENLQIDPTITKYKDEYYLTTTEIIGTINNSDLNKENGNYIIHLFKSKDLSTWEKVSDIANEKNNLEDVDVFFYNDVLYVTYEFEELDKGNSTIMLKTSTDAGKTFSDAKQLLDMNCDHEPVRMVPYQDGFTLYYSCDLENLGKSYQGASCYYATYTKDFERISVDQKIQTENPSGILWYDITWVDGKACMLYSQNYLTDCNMIVEKEV